MFANPLHLLLSMFTFALDVEILTTKINEHELENEKFKFARSMLYNGRRPGIKDGIGF
jgi:hypothetical protein